MCEFGTAEFELIGKCLGLAIYQYEFVNRELEKELQLTRGWLKPKKLLEVTGRTAAENLATEILERK